MSEQLILAADVGGTKTLLRLDRIDDQGKHHELAQEQRASTEYPSLEELVNDFIKKHEVDTLQSACFAVAGPVQQYPDRQVAHLTNLPWQLDSLELSQNLTIPHVTLLNDFQAIGYSLDELSPYERTPLHQAIAEPHGIRLLLGPGTGLGVSLLTYQHGEPVSHPSEGGHLRFAPCDEQQQALLNFMLQEYPRVSYERLLSGPGLINLYRFLLHSESKTSSPLLQKPDPAAAIGKLGLYGEDEIASEAVTLFCRIFGAFTGDLALATLPRGGIFIAGGIAPKLLPRLQEGAFMTAYSDKGRMRELVRSFPVNVITNTDCGLLGAAARAAML